MLCIQCNTVFFYRVFTTLPNVLYWSKTTCWLFSSKYLATTIFICTFGLWLILESIVNKIRILAPRISSKQHRKLVNLHQNRLRDAHQQEQIKLRACSADPLRTRFVCLCFWWVAMFYWCIFTNFCEDMRGVAFIILVSLMPDSDVLFLAFRFHGITTLKCRKVK